MTKQKPSLNGGIGRLPNGQFGVGNKGGPGNPHAKRVNQIRSFLLRAVSDDDLRRIVSALVERAKAGELAAIREVFDRCIGRTVTFSEMRDVEEELERKRKFRLPWQESEDEETTAKPNTRIIARESSELRGRRPVRRRQVRERPGHAGGEAARVISGSRGHRLGLARR